MDTQKTDLVIQYALAVAGQDDGGHHELGPIHLLKYVYLADLAFAEAEGGKTFTGAPWKFHHFGPWAPEVFRRIQPALEAISATERRFTSPYTEDGIRWEVQDRDLADRIDPNLPWPVASTVKRAVRDFGSDTETLLRSVYNTRPMLKAKPGEYLDFRQTSLLRQAPADGPKVDESPKLKPLSKTALNKIRAKLAARSKTANERRLVPPNPPPRYDEVFWEGQRWLDSLAGEEIGRESGRLSFSEDLWTSDSRGEPKLPR